MTLSKEQIQEMETAAKPLIEWINKNCHPHVEVTVTCNTAELLEGVATIRCDDFLQD
jgi:hypothetical protein